MTASTKQNLVTKLLLTFYLLASVLTINGKAIEEKLPGYIENIEKRKSEIYYQMKEFQEYKQNPYSVSDRDNAYYVLSNYLLQRNKKDDMSSLIEEAWSYNFGYEAKELYSKMKDKTGLVDFAENTKEYSFYSKCINDAYQISDYAKNVTKRNRPWLNFIIDFKGKHPNDREKVITEKYGAHAKEVMNGIKDGNRDYTSCPSGHTVVCYVAAFALCHIYPEKIEKIMDFANKYAISRVILGEHHISDVEISRQFAKLIFEEISKEKQFISDLKEIVNNANIEQTNSSIENYIKENKICPNSYTEEFKKVVNDEIFQW